MKITQYAGGEKGVTKQQSLYKKNQDKQKELLAGQK